MGIIGGLLGKLPYGYLVGQSGAGINWLWRDDFTDIVAAGSVDGTAMAPGPGTREVNDDNTVAPVDGSKIVLPPGPVQWGDPGYFHQEGVIRTQGICAFQDVNFVTSVPNINAGWYVDKTDTSQVSTGLVFGGAGLTTVWDGSAKGIVATLALSTRYWLAYMLRTSGCILFIKGGAYTDWTTIWVGDGDSTATLYSGAGTLNVGEIQIFSHRGVQLGSPFDVDYDFATDILAGTQSPGATFTHEADCLIEYTMTALPTTVANIASFRKQDDDNLWKLAVNPDGSTALFERIAASDTLKASSAAGTVSAGDRIVIMCDDATIAVYSGAARIINYVLASTLKTETAGEYEQSGIGDQVDDIVTWPRTPSGDSLAQLEEHIST